MYTSILIFNVFMFLWYWLDDGPWWPKLVANTSKQWTLHRCLRVSTYKFICTLKTTGWSLPRSPLAVEDVTDRLSRIVTNNLPTNDVQLSRRAKTTSNSHNARTSWWTPSDLNLNKIPHGWHIFVLYSSKSSLKRKTAIKKDNRSESSMTLS